MSSVDEELCKMTVGPRKPGSFWMDEGKITDMSYKGSVMSGAFAGVYGLPGEWAFNHTYPDETSSNGPAEESKEGYQTV